MKTYYVEGPVSWCVVRAKNKERARFAGVREFGPGEVREVREATKDELVQYLLRYRAPLRSS